MVKVGKQGAAHTWTNSEDSSLMVGGIAGMALDSAW
jgi:hypothetical protein